MWLRTLLGFPLGSSGEEEPWVDLVLCVWLKWQLVFEHLMCTRPYSELHLIL